MLYLLGSILLTSYLLLSFKVMERYRIPVLQAIVFNYFTCVATGTVMNGAFPINGDSVSEPWFRWACVMGCLFISLFNLIGFTAQKIGVAVASVANKLSLIIPFTFSIYFYNEQATAVKFLGIAVALLAVIATCWPQRSGATAADRRLSPLLAVVAPGILFLGSGFLDTLVKYVEQQYLEEANSNAYLIASFGVAAVTGGILMLFLIATGRQRFDPRSLLAGVIIGIPNYFSIWCLVRVLKESPGNSSAIIPINNMGIVLFSTLVAWLAFREKLSTINWTGILLSVAAIALIAFG